MSFLKAQGIRGMAQKNDWPRYVEEEPEIYEDEQLGTLFAAFTFPPNVNQFWNPIFMPCAPRPPDLKVCSPAPASEKRRSSKNSNSFENNEERALPSEHVSPRIERSGRERFLANLDPQRTLPQPELNERLGAWIEQGGGIKALNPARKPRVIAGSERLMRTNLLSQRRTPLWRRDGR
jgi:hypothetical protein